MSSSWTCTACGRDVLGSACYCMASDEGKLRGRIIELEASERAMRDRMEWTVTDNAKQRMAVADLEAEVERLRGLTRMDLHDAKEWVESLRAATNRIDKLEAQRDRLAAALRELLEDYAGAMSLIEYERGDAHQWTDEEALADLSEQTRAVFAELEGAE